MKEIIKQLIAASQNKMISYADYMENVLYHPEQGYYMKRRQKIGKNGDFYTSSNVSDIYGELIGKWYAMNADKIGLPSVICEIGAGNGRFARAFIQGWNKASDLALIYYIVEASSYHKELQRQELSGLENVEVIYAESFTNSQMTEGLVFSNELFDAFPVHVIEKSEGMIKEVFIAYEDEKFIEKLMPLDNDGIIRFLQEQELNIADGQRIEVPLSMEPFIKTISDKLSRGIMLTADYGYIKADWMEPSRRKGSLRGYYQHQMYHDVLQHPGEMDITSHVHFDVLISLGEKYGLRFLQKKRQDEFLLSIGILEELADHNDTNPFSEASKRNRAIRSLIMPGSISQSFDVILQAKGIQNLPDKLFKQ